MTGEIRGEFHRDLERLDIAVAGLLGLVPDAIVSATTALLVSDASVADGLERWRLLVEELYGDVEHTIEVVVARQAPVAGDLRFVLACVRLVPGLNEVVDLVAEVASPSHRVVGEQLTPDAIRLTEEVGQLTARLWTTVETGWQDRDPVTLRSVRDQADRVWETTRALYAELTTGAVALRVAMEMAVVARTFDRLAGQARTAGARIETLVPKASSEGLA